MTANIENRTIFCKDNLDVMQGINTGCIDLIYLDPPFNKNKEFTAPIGSSAEGASFKDIFREDDLKAEWLQTIEEDTPDLYHYLNGIKGVGKPYNFAYLAYMAIRLIECHRILKPTGSIYLHCDPTMSHYLKSLMDCIFGDDSFRNEIIWHYRKWPTGKYQFQRNHDVILFYGNEKGGRVFNELYMTRAESTSKRFGTGKIVSGHDDEGNRLPSTTVGESEGVRQDDVWPVNRVAPIKQIYPTQKPLALLERIILASSSEGDVVLDPFCGCATTCIAAERLGRSWVGMDISIKAYELVRERLAKETASLNSGDVVVDLKTDPPQRTDQGVDYREHKYVYVISHPNYPEEYKVGIASNWKSRLNAYQTSDPDRQYRIEYKSLTPRFRETEKYIHDTFPNKHEWVQGKLHDIIKAIKEHKPTSEVVR